MEQEEMLAFIQWFAGKIGADVETAQSVLQQKMQDPNGQTELQQLYNQFVQESNGATEQVVAQQSAPTMARMGAKINHIKRVYGMCPEGYELKSFKIGGKVCKKCQKVAKKAEGGDVEKEKNSKAKDSFKKKLQTKK